MPRRSSSSPAPAKYDIVHPGPSKYQATKVSSVLSSFPQVSSTGRFNLALRGAVNTRSHPTSATRQQNFASEAYEA